MPPAPQRRHRHRPRRWLRLAALAAAALTAWTAAPATAAPPLPDTAKAAAPCSRTDTLKVPGAAHQRASCLTELTTAGTVASGHTDPADWAGLAPAGLATPTGVPGIQIDGYFPDTSTTNTNHGWNYDSQFVIRLPDRWNGGLVVSGAPGVREQYANDRAFGDWAVANGYAFAATDKGATGAAFHRDGEAPGDALAEGNHRVTQLTRGRHSRRRPLPPPARPHPGDGHVQRRLPGALAAGEPPRAVRRRRRLGRHPWRTEGPNLLTFLPPALLHYPSYAAGGAGAEQAHRAMRAAGYPVGSEFLWPFHHQHYWDLTQRIYREELDPGFDGATEAGTPFCAPKTPACDADYVYADRPKEVRKAVAKIALTGRIGKPLISFHGTYDVLLPISRSSDVYAQLVKREGRGHLHRYYRVEAGTHVDSLADAFPGRVRPLVPCHRSAATALERWLDHGVRPPSSRTLKLPAGADAGKLLTYCPLTG
ncbi:Tannase/feruloyl esterase family alpha/beta hydrolase OS=Streptomyces cyaneofuscatus OX=66883 GN=G3I52_33720 PE=3 SV=1 [Streptomyces cyaneofuscatus]